MEAAKLLERLSRDSQENQLMAYQIAFDLYESATQNFLTRVLNELKRTQKAFLPASVTAETSKPGASDVTMEVEESEGAEAVPVDSKPVTEEAKKHWEQMIQILSGEV